MPNVRAGRIDPGQSLPRCVIAPLRPGFFGELLGQENPAIVDQALQAMGGNVQGGDVERIFPLLPRSWPAGPEALCRSLARYPPAPSLPPCSVCDFRVYRARPAPARRCGFHPSAGISRLQPVPRQALRRSSAPERSRCPICRGNSAGCHCGGSAWMNRQIGVGVGARRGLLSQYRQFA